MSNFEINKKKHNIHASMKISNIILKDKNGKEIKRNINGNKKE